MLMLAFACRDSDQPQRVQAPDPTLHQAGGCSEFRAEGETSVEEPRLCRVRGEGILPTNLLLRASAPSTDDARLGKAV